MKNKKLITLSSFLLGGILALSACVPMAANAEEKAEQATGTLCQVLPGNAVALEQISDHVWVPIYAASQGGIPDSVLSDSGANYFDAALEGDLFPEQGLSIADVNQQFEVSMVGLGKNIYCP